MKALLFLHLDEELFEEAMQNGYVSLGTTVLLLIGVAGAGKTSFCHLLFDEPPPLDRKSTPLAKSSIRAIAFTRAIIDAHKKEVIWKRVTSQKFKLLVADAIKGLSALEQLQPVTVSQSFQVPRKLNLRACLQLIREPSTHRQHLDDPTSFPHEHADPDYDEGEHRYKDPSSDNSRSENAQSMDISRRIHSIFELKPVKELLHLVETSKGSVELFQQRWVYVIDSGGQPQFHELLPTFIHHVSAAAFFVKLNETLDNHPMIEYYNEVGVRCGQPYKSSFTHKQTLQNCLQAIQSKYDNKGTKECPELFFIGTHYDLESKKEPLKSKNRQLSEMLLSHSVFRNHLAHYSVGKSDELLYPVNAKTPGKADTKIGSIFRQDVIRRCERSTNDYKIPIRWFLLEMLLQDLSQDGVIGFKECSEVANHLGMDERRVRVAISYMTKVNIFEYFPDVLPNVVFTTSQVLLNKITELVEYSHELHSGSILHSDPADINFRDYGQICLELLSRDRFSKYYVKGLFEARDLLKLLIEVLVVAKGTNDTLIVPAVLPELPLDQITKYRLAMSSTLVPIAVYYPEGMFPSGMFSSLISYLQNNSECKLLMSYGKPVCLYKNCVQLSISGRVAANMTLIYLHDWIELHATILDRDQQQAYLLRDILFNGLKHVAEVQKYNSLTPKLAFFCPCKGSRQSTLHLATPITPNNEFMRCRLNESLCIEVTERHKPWLGVQGT